MAAKSLALQVGVVPACRALGVSRATFYRRERMVPGRQQPRPTPARALCDTERERVLDTLAWIFGRLEVKRRSTRGRGGSAHAHALWNEGLRRRRGD